MCLNKCQRVAQCERQRAMGWRNMESSAGSRKFHESNSAESMPLWTESTMLATGSSLLCNRQELALPALNHQSRTRARSRPTVWQHVTGSQRLEILDKSLRKELPADS